MARKVLVVCVDVRTKAHPTVLSHKYSEIKRHDLWHSKHVPVCLPIVVDVADSFFVKYDHYATQS